jgi:hypothetical protein
VSRKPDVGLEDLLVSEERGTTNRAGFIWDTYCSNLIVHVSRFFIFGRRCRHKEPVQDTHLLLQHCENVHEKKQRYTC